MKPKKCWYCKHLVKCKKIEPCERFERYPYDKSIISNKDLAKKLGITERTLFRRLEINPKKLFAEIEEKLGFVVEYKKTTLKKHFIRVDEE